MSLVLEGPSINPTQARTIFVMLHGYGASGDDLFPLVESWACDDLAVWTPNAPIATGYGRCWFEFENVTRRDIERTIGLQETTKPTYQAILDYVQKYSYESVIIGGFSQGAMVALHIMATYQPSWPVLAYGGGFFTLNSLNLKGSEVCMIHGSHDDVVEPTYLTEAMLALAARGASVDGHLRPFVGHSIDPKGEEIGRHFVGRHINKGKRIGYGA